MARTPKTEAPSPREWTPEEEADFRDRMVESYKGYVAEDVANIASALRRRADEIERLGRDIFDSESTFSNPQDRAARILHEIMWMVPNLNLEGLLKHVNQVEDAKVWTRKSEG